MAQEALVPDVPPTGGASVAFFDAAGLVIYRIPRDEALDASAMQRALWIAKLYERFATHADSDPRAAEALESMKVQWKGLGSGGATVGSGEAEAEIPTAEAPRPGEGEFIISGDLSAALVSGTFVLFQSAGSGRASGMSGARGMTTLGGGIKEGGAEKKEPDRVPGEIARAELADGRFTLRGKVGQVRQVFFYVLDARTKEGRRMAPTKGQGFILEPGLLTLTMNRNHKHRLSGGPINDAVYGSWQNTAAYRDLQALLPLAYRRVEGESEAERKAFQRIGGAVQSALLDAETAGRKEVALNHPDLLVRQLTLETTWLGGSWMLEAARGIVAQDPENAWGKAYVARAEEAAARRNRAATAGSVGGRYLPFTAEGLDGQDVSLSRTRAKNRFVLLEFWASWCGPCRAEIPHMKKAYERFGARGFEIFSYTLDDDRKAWARASKEEQLPWINTGLGSKSDPVLLYSVTGVPANYLIDSATGKVVGRDLRGEALEKKLEQLIGKAAQKGQ